MNHALIIQSVKKLIKILEKVQQDRHISSVDIGMELGIDNKTVLKHLRKAGYKKKIGIWVPHQLSVKKMTEQINHLLRC